MPSKPGASEGQILNIVHGSYDFQPWYPSYYPETIIGPFPVDRLFVCQNCYKYTTDGNAFYAHLMTCEDFNRFPGTVIRELHDPRGIFQLHEVDGEDETLFCQNLSLFSKLFLEQKSVCFAPQPFTYYLLTCAPANAVNRNRRVPVGFFSKEKLSWDNNVLACILVFPAFQRRGYGQLLMHWSYELARDEGRRGGPEKRRSAHYLHPVCHCQRLVLLGYSDETLARGNTDLYR